MVDILAIGAHPDDVELAYAGTLLAHQALGQSVAIVDLTRGELGTRGSAELRDKEALASAKILGISERINLGLKDGFFNHEEQSLLKVVEAIRYFKPQIIIANAKEDRHPDHGIASSLVSRACFLAGLTKIKTNYNNQEQIAHRPKAVYHSIQDRYLKPDLVVDITPFFEQKKQSILAFGSQFFNPESKEPSTPISSEEFLHFLEGRAREMGRLIGVKYGEGFTVERAIGVDNLLKLT
jgi:N-acetylglucosamine malate deacetylase 1